MKCSVRGRVGNGGIGQWNGRKGDCQSIKTHINCLLIVGVCRRKVEFNATFCELNITGRGGELREGDNKGLLGRLVSSVKVHNY